MITHYNLALLNAEDPVAVRWARRVLGPPAGDVVVAMNLYGVGVCSRDRVIDSDGNSAWLSIIWPLGDEPFPSAVRSCGLSGYKTRERAAEAVRGAYDALSPKDRLFTLSRKHWGVRTAPFDKD